VALLSGPWAWGQQAKDLQEQRVTLPVTLKSLWNGQQTHDMLLTVYRPQGQGPFPLAVISHGRSMANRDLPKVQRFESQSRFFVRKGFVVLVPTRVGYGDTGQSFDPEDSAAAGHVDYRWLLEATATQIMAAIEYGRTLPGVDPQRLVLVGQSVGGLATVNAAARNPPGLVLAINFAGGAGGDPDKHPGLPQGANQLKDIFAELGRKAKAPMLWIYTENDRFFAPKVSKAWAKAYADAGGQVDYRLLPPFSDNGHDLFRRGCDLWMPLVEDYLNQAGFTRPGLIPRPKPSGFAGLGEVDKVPNLSPSGVDGYREFLKKDLPRAFAISGDGHWGLATGDDALARALANCQRNAATEAKLYAVDGDVVW
jgi:dienelactone hydrolase